MRKIVPILLAVMVSFQIGAAEKHTFDVQLHRHEGALTAQFTVSNFAAPQSEALRRATASQLVDAFSIYVAPASIAETVDLPPVLGKHRVDENRLIFEPQFPLEPGLEYRAVFRPLKIGLNSPTVEKEFKIPARPMVRSTVVANVYPSADELPENQLKFYVHFSAPMNRGGVYSHIHLLDAQGNEVNYPFLELDEELWDPEGMRLTVFIDPGRIKREVRPLEEVGPALIAGRAYTFLVDENLRDAGNNLLKSEHRKPFRVGPPDRRSPDPKEWKMTLPSGGSSDALVLEIPEPLDHALMQRLIRIKSASGESLPGRIETANQERRWTFTPREPWRAGKYVLSVETMLEDLAGNSVGKLFEVDLFNAVDRQIKRETVSLPFVVRGR